MLYPYNKKTDTIISDAIVNGFELLSDATIRYKDDEKTYTIWVGNYPYAYGLVDNVRPSRETILNLRYAIKHYKKMYPEYFL
jgi:hypothetical protein